MRRPAIALVLSVLSVLAGCGGAADDPGRSARPGGGRPAGGGGPRGEATTAVPVEAATARLDEIAAYIETNGSLEAELEVDVISRTTGPIARLEVEEGDRVARGALIARLEQSEVRAQLEIERVALVEAELAHERAKTLQRERLISTEAFEQARSAHESARARFEGAQVLFDYTEIRAPFAGTIVARYVDRSQSVGAGDAIVRLSDFDPLLCPIRVPERELRRLRPGQPAYLTVEAFPGERFDARVLRISPVVDPATGTIKVTLDVDGRGLARPGMFARVFLETDVRRGTVVVPRSAIALESAGEAVYVVRDSTAERREVATGFETGDRVEIVSGLTAGETIVLVGQDGLSDGTPVRVVRLDDAAVATPAPAAAPVAGTDR